MLEIAENSEWDDLLPELQVFTKRALVCLGFHCAWLVHGLGIGYASRMVRRLLSIYDDTLPQRIATIA